MDKAPAFYRRILTLGLAGALLGYALLPETTEAKTKNQSNISTSVQKKAKKQVHKHRHHHYEDIPVPHVGHQHLVPELPVRVSLADRSSIDGRIERALRWKNITDAVEQRYGVPSSYLLGMICVESEGDPTQPNASGDGGLGLIHMQPLTASLYGLRLITKSTKLVDHLQGKKIEDIIDRMNGDLEELIKYDDRFHPIKNIDAAARMMCDLYERTHSLSRALEKFSGRGRYDSKVLGYAGKINSRLHRRGLAAKFNDRNKDNSLHGKKLTFERYLTYFHERNKNFGLEHYQKQRRYKVE